MRRAVHWGSLTLLLACAATLVVVVLFGPYRVFAVRTGSMTPTFPPRSAVVVDSDNYHVGEVVSFRHEGGVITHRLVSRDADGGLHTKGDANEVADPWTIHSSDVIGHVVAAPKYVGYWLVYLKNPAGLGSTLLGAVALWLFWSRPATDIPKGRGSVEPAQ